MLQFRPCKSRTTTTKRDSARRDQRDDSRIRFTCCPSTHPSFPRFDGTPCRLMKRLMEATITRPLSRVDIVRKSRIASAHAAAMFISPVNEYLCARVISHGGDRPPLLPDAGEPEDQRPPRRGVDGAHHRNTAFSYFAIPSFCSRAEVGKRGTKARGRKGEGGIGGGRDDGRN